ncbi:MAG: 1-acyl-sn-glycerol-3-phosphate acyltransferase [Nitriliruptoraceae bacterium]
MPHEQPRGTDRPPVAWRLALWSVVGLLRTVFGWRLRVRPPARPVRRDQPLIVVFNHTSMIDAFLVAASVWLGLRRWVQPLVKSELYQAPLLGALVRRAGTIPVERTADTGREAAYGHAIARLAEGGTILIAPEGTTTHDGSLLPLRHGAARLALETGTDVLVVTHLGAQRAFSPVVRRPERGVEVTMAIDLIRPRPDEDASALTGRIAATMIDRSAELLDAYPQPDPTARWWPPYATPASPTATGRDSLERYRHSMAEAVAHARQRMAQLAEEYALEERVAHARERARTVTGELAERGRERAEELGEQARERAEEFSEQARERAEELGELARGRLEELTSQARERSTYLHRPHGDDPRDDALRGDDPRDDEPRDDEAAPSPHEDQAGTP